MVEFASSGGYQYLVWLMDYYLSFLLMDEMTEDELFQCTRFTRPAGVELLELVRDDLERPTSRHHAVPVDTPLLAALQLLNRRIVEMIQSG